MCVLTLTLTLTHSLTGADIVPDLVEKNTKLFAAQATPAIAGLL